jgi:hypothetical protein
VLIEVLQVLGTDRDKMVIVGGSVPELLFPGSGHIGTIDVDLAVSATARSGKAYQSMLRKLLDAGFKHQSGPTRFLKNVEGVEDPVKLDLISGEYQGSGKADTVQVDELQLSALRGIDLALEYSREIRISGVMPDGTSNSVRARIVEPEAFILVKAFALDDRKKEKDAYDIVFVLRNFKPNVEALAKRLRPLLTKGLAREGYDILKSKFKSIDSVGPVWAASVYGGSREEVEQSQRAAYEYAQALFRAAEK